MTPMEMHDHARRLVEAYGEKASLIAAQRARGFEDEGDQAQAGIWRRIETVIAELRSTPAG